MKTFREYLEEASIGRTVNRLLKRDQSPKEMANRTAIHKKVLSTFGNDAEGEAKLANAVKRKSNAMWTLAQHMEHNPEFQKRVITHLEKGHNPGDTNRANFLRDRMHVNDYLRKNHPDKYDDIRDGTKKYDHKTGSFVAASKNDVIPGHKDWKPPTSPEESYERVNNPNSPEHNPYLAKAIREVKKTRPQGYRFTQPSFAVNSKDWIEK